MSEERDEPLGRGPADEPAQGSLPGIGLARKGQLRGRRALLVVGLLLAAVAVVYALLPEPYSVEEVRWRNGGVELFGRLYVPRGAGPHPAVGIVHGWGCATRTDLLFRVHAERLASKGLAALVYDKRGCGESTGHWRTATLRDLADDALGGVALLERDARIDAERIGLLGTSLGGSVALLAASVSPRIAFLATLSLSTRPPVEHRPFIVEQTLRRAGWSEEVVTRAGELMRRILEVVRTDRGWDEMRADVERHRAEPWFADSGIELDPEPPGNWPWYRDLPMDFACLPLLAELEIPFFAAQGEEDWLVPGPLAAQVLEELEREHSKDFTIVLVPGAEHTLRTRSSGLRRRWTWPAAYWQALEAWLEAHVLEAR